MAITFKIPTSGDRTQTFMDAQSSNASRGLGDKRTNLVNLPTENRAANINMMLRTGESNAQLLGSIGRLAEGAGQYLQNHLEAEDNTRMDEVKNKMRLARINVQRINQERAVKGEISFGQIADENQKALDFEYNAIIENTPFNFNGIKDTLKTQAETDRLQVFAEDTNQFVKMNTSNAIKAYENNLNIIGHTMREGIGEYQKGVQELEALKSHPLYSLNPTAYDQEIFNVKAQAAKEHLKILAKTNPSEYHRLRSDGTLETAFGSVIPKSSFDVFDNDAQETELQLSNKAESEFNKRSTELSYEYLMGLQAGEVLTESEILENSDLNDAHKISLLSKIEAIRDQENKIAQQREYLKTITLDGSTGVNLEDEDVDEYYIQKGGVITNAVMMNDPSQITEIVKQNLNFYGGRLPKSLTNALRLAPKEDNEEVWAQAIRDISITHPEVSKSIPDAYTAAAFIIEAEPGTTFTDAITKYQQREATYKSDVESKKHFDDSKLLKESHYKNPIGYISDNLNVNEEQVPDGLRARFLLEYRKAAQLMPEADQEVLAAQALGKTGYGKSHVGNQRIMLNAPDSVYKGPALEQFTKNYERVVLEVNKNRSAMGRAEYDNDSLTVIRHPENKNGYLLQDTKSGQILTDENHKPISINSDKTVYELNDERLKRGGIAIEREYTKDSKYIKESQQVLLKIEKKYDSLKRFPGVLDAIWSQESSRGKNMLSSAGAKGHFQFMDGTARDMGVSDVNNLEDSGEGAAKYMDQLLNRYEGNIKHALAAYNWGMGNVDNWLKDGAKQNKLPAETKNYIIKVSKNIDHGAYLRNTRESVIRFRKRG